MTDVFPNCKLWRDDHSDFKDSDFDGNQQLESGNGNMTTQTGST